MGKLIADEFMSMDGVAQAPSYPDEDADGAFGHGGWHTPFLDEVSMTRLVENVTSAGCYLLGRRTYEIFAAHWPHAAEEEQALAQPLNERPKYIVSTTLSEPWTGRTPACFKAMSPSPSKRSRPTSKVTSTSSEAPCWRAPCSNRTSSTSSD
jgi:dihydrofolate reductase